MRDDDPRPRRRKRDREDVRDDDPPPRRRNRDRDEEPARPTRKGRGPLIVVLAGVGLLVLVGAGLGAYFLFAGGSGKSAEDKARPRRELKPGMFAYVPDPVYRVHYADYDLMRELGDPTAGEELSRLIPKEGGISADQVAALCSAQETYGGKPEVTLLSFTGPQDLAALAARWRLKPHPDKVAGAYELKDVLDHWVAFQPAPTKIVLINNKFEGRVERPIKLAELMARDPNGSALPAELREGLAEVSGYPRLNGHVGRHKTPGQKSPAMSQFSGQLVDAQFVREEYAFQHYHGAGTAKAALDSLDKLNGKPLPKQKEDLEKYRWLQGERLYWWARVQLTRK